MKTTIVIENNNPNGAILGYMSGAGRFAQINPNELFKTFDIINEWCSWHHTLYEYPTGKIRLLLGYCGVSNKMVPIFLVFGFDGNSIIPVRVTNNEKSEEILPYYWSEMPPIDNLPDNCGKVIDLWNRTIPDKSDLKRWPIQLEKIWPKDCYFNLPKSYGLMLNSDTLTFIRIVNGKCESIDIEKPWRNDEYAFAIDSEIMRINNCRNALSLRIPPVFFLMYNKFIGESIIERPNNTRILDCKFVGFNDSIII